MEPNYAATSESSKTLYVVVGILVGVIVILITAFACNLNKRGSPPADEQLMEQYLKQLQRQKRKEKKGHDKKSEHKHHRHDEKSQRRPAEETAQSSTFGRAEEQRVAPKREVPANLEPLELDDSKDQPKEEKSVVVVRQSQRKIQGKKQSHSFFDVRSTDNQLE